MNRKSEAVWHVVLCYSISRFYAGLDARCYMCFHNYLIKVLCALFCFDMLTAPSLILYRSKRHFELQHRLAPFSLPQRPLCTPICFKKAPNLQLHRLTWQLGVLSLPLLNFLSGWSTESLKWKPVAPGPVIDCAYLRRAGRGWLHQYL